MSDAVVDASVILLALEPNGHAARRALVALAEDRRLAAPTLLAWELGHVIYRKHPARYGGSTPERDEALAAALHAVSLVAPDADALRRTARLAESHRLSFYDAAYLEVASRDAGSVLVTADDALLKAARRALGAEAGMTVEDAASLAE